MASLLLPGCALIYSGKDIEEHIQLLKQQNPIGCAYIAGSGTPPASRIDGGAVGAWGDGATADFLITCLEQLKGVQ
jgi:hypothetical protein